MKTQYLAKHLYGIKEFGEIMVDDKTIEPYPIFVCEEEDKVVYYRPMTAQDFKRCLKLLSNDFFKQNQNNRETKAVLKQAIFCASEKFIPDVKVRRAYVKSCKEFVARSFKKCNEIEKI